MELRRHASTPLMVTGVYMPTGNGARHIRETIYKFIQQNLCEAPESAHIVAGDMNAALYKTDREEGRKGQHDKGYRDFVHLAGLQPFDNNQQGGCRDKTFYQETAETGTTEISRIDDILTQTRYADKPGAAVHTVNTQDCHTDHNILCAEIPYLLMGQLPLPKIEEARTAHRTVLVNPMSKEDKQALRLAMDEQMNWQIKALWHDLKEVVDTHVLPHWEMWTELENTA